MSWFSRKKILSTFWAQKYLGWIIDIGLKMGSSLFGLMFGLDYIDLARWVSLAIIKPKIIWIVIFIL